MGILKATNQAELKTETHIPPIRAYTNSVIIKSKIKPDKGGTSCNRFKASKQANNNNGEKEENFLHYANKPHENAPASTMIRPGRARRIIGPQF